MLNKYLFNLTIYIIKKILKPLMLIKFMVVCEDRIKEFMDKNYESFMKKHMGLEPPFKLVSEYTIKNGQQVDKVIIGTDKKILTLIECKGEVNLNEFVRGTGQAIQGAFQIKKNLDNNFSENAKSFLLVPIEMAKRIPLNLFDYHNFILIFADCNKNITIEYDEKDYASTQTESWVTINPYYFRDCSLEGVYFYLKYILRNSANPNERLTLSQMEKETKRVRDESKNDFYGDIRNNHIVPSVLGFYDPASKTLTNRGYEFAKKNFEDFCKEIVLKELGEYSRAVFLSIIALSKESEKVGAYSKISTEEIANFIKTIYEGKNVTYLFDPDGGNRNLLTMIRMLETVGSIERTKQGIKINYFPLEGMPFKMSEFNPGYGDKLKFWFEKFNFDF